MHTRILYIIYVISSWVCTHIQKSYKKYIALLIYIVVGFSDKAHFCSSHTRAFLRVFLEDVKPFIASVSCCRLSSAQIDLLLDRTPQTFIKCSCLDGPDILRDALENSLVSCKEAGPLWG